jgi:hypothetical protein
LEIYKHSINRSFNSMSKKQHKQSDRPKPTAVNHARLAEKCKQLGVPHYTVDNPNPAHLAAMKEIFGSGPVLFTSVRPSSTPNSDESPNKSQSD